jgi:hypothetical protein
MLKRVLAAVLLMMPAGILPAEMVSFMVVETGLQGGKTGASGLWESGFMDVFFDAGHIVSNAPGMRLDQPLSEQPVDAFPEEARRDLEEALNGGSDFFVLVLLDYAGSSPAARGGQVSLRLWRLHPYQFMFERHYTARANMTSAEELADIKNAARTIMSHLKDQ